MSKPNQNDIYSFCNRMYMWVYPVGADAKLWALASQIVGFIRGKCLYGLDIIAPDLSLCSCEMYVCKTSLLHKKAPAPNLKNPKVFQRDDPIVLFYNRINSEQIKNLKLIDLIAFALYSVW